MKKYYVHNGTEQSGPYDKPELKVLNITKETPIWYNGLSEWAKAGEIAEISDLFDNSMPPPFKPKEEPKQEQPYITSRPAAPVRSQRKGIGAVGVIAIVLGVLFVVVAGLYAGYRYLTYNDNSNYDNYYQEVMTVEEKERAEPTNFLNASGTYRSAVIGDAYKIDGTLTNSASIVSYKNVGVRVTYYNENGEEITSLHFSVDGLFPPGQTTPFELRVENINGSSTIGWDVYSAEAQ